MGLTAGAALTAAGTAGCGSGGSGSGSGELRLVAAEYGRASGVSSTQHYWQDVVDAFSRGNPDIGVDVSVVRWQDANIDVGRQVADGQAPDIAQISSFADLAADGQLYPAEELLSLPQLADFLPALAQAGERAFDQYAMPFASLTWRLFYNPELFENAGLDPERPPRDWDELLDAAVALRDADVRVPFSLPLGHQEAYSEAALWMIGGGGGIADTTGNYSIDVEENVQTFTWLRDEFVSRGLNGGSQPSAVSRDQAYADFAGGVAGMVFGHPLMARYAEEVDLPFATATIPGSTGPVVSTLGEASWILALNQRGNKEDVSTFLQYVFDSGQVTSFAEHYGLLPVTVPATDALRESGDPAYLLPFLDDLDTATFHPVWKVTWSQVAASLGEGIGQALQPGSDIAGVLGEIQAEADTAERSPGE
jgi:multiple sugar transport system substrate-binding protein